MEKFRVISDLHIDLNAGHLPEFKDKDIFAVICGDTSGYPELTIEYINSNFMNGICCSGNHLPYNRDSLPIQELRDKLHNAFPASSSMTYLDAECGIVSKEVDGILFIGTCFYSDMKIKSKVNPDGDVMANECISARRMNDYKYGISKIVNGIPEHITPGDYVRWNANALEKLGEVLDENEKLVKPKPVVLVTHYPLVREVVEHSYYVSEDNYPSYGNDMAWWLEKHPSIKCCCCGHCHDIDKKWRSFDIYRKDGSRILIVNNSYGYWRNVHDKDFNPNRFVDVKTWNTVEIPESKAVKAEKKKRFDEMFAYMSMFGI